MSYNTRPWRGCYEYHPQGMEYFGYDVVFLLETSLEGFFCWRIRWFYDPPENYWVGNFRDFCWWSTPVAGGTFEKVTLKDPQKTHTKWECQYGRMRSFRGWPGVIKSYHIPILKGIKECKGMVILPDFEFFFVHEVRVAWHALYDASLGGY